MNSLKFDTDVYEFLQIDIRIGILMLVFYCVSIVRRSNYEEGEHC